MKRLINTIIKCHCRQVREIIKYVRKGASDDFREQFLKIIIWGDTKLPVLDKYILTKEQIQREKNWSSFSGWKTLGEETQRIEQNRKPQIELIKRFSVQNLKKLCEEPQFLRNSFLEFYQSSSSSSSEFIKFALSKVLESVKFYDWSILPEFYS